MNVTYIGKDQNWQDEYTVYWFRLDGVDNGTNCAFDDEIYGICESGPNCYVVDCDNCRCTAGDYRTIAVQRQCTVTDEMRSE